MSEFVIKATGELLSAKELQARYPDTSNPQALPEVAAVQEVQPPQFDGVVERDGVEEVDGVWQQKWSTRPYTAVELQSQFDTRRAQLLNFATALRWEHETGGVTLPGGIRVKTDRESQAQVNAAYTSLQGGLIPDTPFKAENGWVRVTFAEIEPLARVVAMHVRSCFAAEEAHQEAIKALADDDLAKYDVTTGWPE